MSKNGTPQNQANNSGTLRAGKGGIVPPVEHRFKPGQSGNPGGRPKGRTLYSAIVEELDANGGKARTAVAKSYVGSMKRGSYNHAKEIIEREEGKLPEDGTVRIEIVYVNADPHDTAEDETAARRAAASN